MVMTEMVVETSVRYRRLTWLTAREDLIEFSRLKSPGTYTNIRVRQWEDLLNDSHLEECDGERIILKRILLCE